MKTIFDPPSTWKIELLPEALTIHSVQFGSCFPVDEGEDKL